MERMTNKLTRTAPPRIWLQCSDDPGDVRSNFCDCDAGDVTWCKDSVLAAEVEYVRADLVREIMPCNLDELADDDPEMYRLGQMRGMTANA